MDEKDSPCLRIHAHLYNRISNEFRDLCAQGYKQRAQSARPACKKHNLIYRSRVTGSELAVYTPRFHIRGLARSSSIYCKMFLPLGICLLGALGVRGVTRQVAGT